MPPHIFKVQFQHTLGYINKAYDPTPLHSTNAPGSTFDPQPGPQILRRLRQTAVHSRGWFGTIGRLPMWRS